MEFKFRAWDLEEEEWYYPGDEDFADRLQYGYTMSKEFIPFTLTVEGCRLSQFTGLHDKNGKEIYEADIVKLEDGVWQVTVSDLEGGVILRRGTELSEGHFDGDYSLVDCEVIGNVYEDPELLK